MGCSSSLVSKFNKKKGIPGIEISDLNSNTTGNKVATTTTTATKENETYGKQAEKEKLRGDVLKKYEARKERERKLREKQRRVTTAAEELSYKVLEEKEMLSLTSKSRGTSRATSRTASPTGNKKQVSFQPSVPEITSEGGDRVDNSVQNGEVRSIS